MEITNLPTLKIHKLTQKQYERELAAGRIDENALYLTPDEDPSGYVTRHQGTANVGKILIVGADGNLTLGDIPQGAGSDVIGTIDENNNIIIITGDLAGGTYVFKYEGADGTYSDIGSLVVGGVVQYSIIPTLTNCTASNSNAKVITADGSVTLKFIADNGHVLPESIAVSGAAYTWDAATGTLVLSEPTTDVTVTITATVYTA